VIEALKTRTGGRVDPGGVQVLDVFLFLQQRFINLILLIHQSRERRVDLHRERQRECVLVRDRGQEREKEGEALSERPHLTFEQFVQRISISSSSERRSSRWCGSLCCEGVVVWLTVPGRHAIEAIEKSMKREGGHSVSLTTTRAC
jgi:hypothetical protein